ncbi:unnamed protein product, partial [Ectocarpus sp. 8 AP-2014]
PTCRDTYIVEAVRFSVLVSAVQGPRNLLLGSRREKQGGSCQLSLVSGLGPSNRCACAHAEIKVSLKDTSKRQESRQSGKQDGRHGYARAQRRCPRGNRFLLRDALDPR